MDQMGVEVLRKRGWENSKNKKVDEICAQTKTESKSTKLIKSKGKQRHFSEKKPRTLYESTKQRTSVEISCSRKRKLLNKCILIGP